MNTKCRMRLLQIDQMHATAAEKLTMRIAAVTENFVEESDRVVEKRLQRAEELLRALVGDESGIYGGHGTFAGSNAYCCCYCRGSKAFTSMEHFKHESSCITEIARAFLKKGL